MAASTPQIFRLLCFGNSLTQGWSRGGLACYPYSEHLRIPLQHIMPNSQIEIDVDGLPGDRVVGNGAQFLRRIESRCQGKAKPRYDWVLMMGGTNDLGWGFPPDKLYDGLKIAWNVALNSGAKVLAVNIIEAAAPNPGLIERRNELNQLIANHKEDRWFHMDLCSAIPYFSMGEEERERFWDDGLHLTEAGYERMGQVIANRLVELLSNEE